MAARRPRDHLQGAARAIVLGGGEPGCEALKTLETMRRFRKFVDVRFVWPDWLNNSRRRFYFFYGEDDLEKSLGSAADRKMIEFIRSLPRAPKNRRRPIQITGRVLEQIRMFECAERLNFKKEQIIAKRFDGKLLYRLVERNNINLIVVAGFGGKIPQRVVDLVVKKRGGLVVICHPTPAIDNERTRYLPRSKAHRGAQIFEKMVNSRKSLLLQVVLLEAGREWDSGRILAARHSFHAPEFMDVEMKKEFLPKRVQRLLTVIAAEIGDTLRYRLLPLIFTVDELLEGGYGRAKLLRMGISDKAVRAALERKRRRREKNGVA